jgi:RNA polymerase primary sigma factor
MSKAKIPAGGDGDSDALKSYLRQLGTIDVPTADGLRQLWSDFKDAAGKFRDSVCRFGFTGREILTVIDRSTAGEADIAELFFPSAFPDKKVPSPLFFAGWRKEIAAAVGELEKKAPFEEDCCQCRDAMAEIVGRYPLLFVIAEEYFNIICGYLRMLYPDFDADYPERTDYRTPAAGEDQIDLVVGKLMMNTVEFPVEIPRLCKAAREYSEQRNRMVESNLRLVVSIAQKYRNRGVAFGDLIQEGNLGLMRAIGRFDIGLGYKFSTYASWWIKHNIFRVIASQSRVIRLPMSMIKLIQDIRKNEQKFLQLNGREPENWELATQMELPEARISAVRKMAMQTISLQSQIGNEDDGTVLEELIADQGAYEPAHELARRILYDRFREMLGTLPEREQQIIIMRFGLFGNKPMPLDEISKRLHLTRERVRQLEIKILASLRSPEKLKYIDGCIHPGGF